MEGWWWPGFFIQFAIFMTVVLITTWLFIRWGTRQVEKHLDALDEERRQQDERRKEARDD